MVKFTDLKISQLIKNSITRDNPEVNLNELGKQIIAWDKRNNNLSYKMRSMFVVKDDPFGVAKKGDKHFKKEEHIKYRNINYYDKKTRENLRTILNCFDIPQRNQIGFTKGKGLHNISDLPTIQGKTKIKFDIEKAFDNITKSLLKSILITVYNINKYKAETIADKWTTKGYMVQGHPLTPAVFNLITRPIIDYFNKYLKDIDVIQYADDILFIDNKYEYVSWKTINIIKDRFKEFGFPVNVEKEGIYHGNAQLNFIGLTYRYDERIKGFGWFSANSRNNKKKVRKLTYIVKKSKLSQKELKKGLLRSKENKSIYDIIKGIENWIKSDFNSKWELTTYDNKKIKGKSDIDKALKKIIILEKGGTKVSQEFLNLCEHNENLKAYIKKILQKQLITSH